MRILRTTGRANRVPPYAVVAVLSGLTSCGGEKISPQPAVEVTVSASPNGARAGDSITITVTATNISDDPQQMFEADCHPAFVVTDSTGQPVAPPMYQFCAGADKPLLLEPKGRYSVRQLWRGDATESTDPNRPIFLAPGSYTIRGNLHVDGLAIRVVPTEVHIVP
jgi:hypothetical protein